MSDERLFLNGIDALTGQYLVDDLTLDAAAEILRRPARPGGPDAWLIERGSDLQSGRYFALPADVVPEDVAQAGWAVVFTPTTPADVRGALKPLIELRQKQVPAAVFKELEYCPGESREQWLGKYGSHGANVDPAKVPYYVLLVGGPEQIPFEFQFLLDVDYAVG